MRASRLFRHTAGAAFNTRRKRKSYRARFLSFLCPPLNPFLLPRSTTSYRAYESATVSDEMRRDSISYIRERETRGRVYILLSTLRRRRSRQLTPYPFEDFTIVGRVSRYLTLVNQAAGSSNRADFYDG